MPPAAPRTATLEAYDMEEAGTVSAGMAMWSEESGRVRSSMQDQELEERRQQLAYLASGGREGTLLEEVEGLTSGKHDGMSGGGCGWMEGREGGEERKRTRKRSQQKADGHGTPLFLATLFGGGPCRPPDTRPISYYGA